MSREKEKTAAAVSVYLALMMAVLIPLILTMIESTRVNVIKLRLECAVDLSMDSVLAEYNKELLKQYDLLFVDTAYDGGSATLDTMLDHLEDYVSYNIRPTKGQWVWGSRDLTGLRLDSVEVIKVSRATDEDGAVFRYMAMCSMLERYGLAYVEDIQDMVETSSREDLNGTDVTEELSEAQGAVDAIRYPEPEPEYDASGNEIPWTPPAKDDPAEKVNAASKGFLLNQVCKGEVSAAEANLALYASHRNLIRGDGMCEDWEPHDSMPEQLLFNEYIIEKCGNYRKLKENSHLAYETEYIVAGKESDEANLNAVALRLMLLRGAANTMYFYSHKNLTEEAKGLATALAYVILLPETEGFFEALIDAAWIYAETVYDVKTLFNGGKIPLLKGEGEWNLGLAEALSMSFAGGAEGEGNGQAYEDYLRMFLFATSLEDRTKRCMDVVEMDIRRVSGYESFCLDNCVAAVSIQLIFCSKYGYSFLMERRFRYA